MNSFQGWNQDAKDSIRHGMRPYIVAENKEASGVKELAKRFEVVPMTYAEALNNDSFMGQYASYILSQIPEALKTKLNDFKVTAQEYYTVFPYVNIDATIKTALSDTDPLEDKKVHFEFTYLPAKQVIEALISYDGDVLANDLPLLNTRGNPSSFYPVDSLLNKIAITALDLIESVFSLSSSVQVIKNL